MTRRRRLVSLAVAVTAALVGVVVTGAAYVATGAPLVRVVATGEGENAWRPDAPLFVLLLGDDRRAGAGCGCADAVHLVAVPAGGGAATILNIPRDTRVAVPGVGMRKVNEALPRGGARLAADTVGAFVGVDIAYTVVVGFDAFPALVDELGGLTVELPSAIRDAAAGAVLPAGPVAMDGATALAYARARKSLPRGDIQRTENQGRLLLGALAELHRRGTALPDVLRHLAVFARHTRLEGMGTTDLVNLARVAAAIDPTAVRNVTMPAAGATIGGTSYVVATEAAAGLFADLADDAVLQAH